MTKLLNPIFILWILIAFTLILKWRKRKGFLKLGYASLAWLFIITVSPIPNILIYSLESQNKTISLKVLQRKQPLNILILGSGQTNDTTLTHLNRLGTSALARLSEGVRIYNKIPNSKLVCSGFANGKPMAQAKMLALAALELGISEKDTLVLLKPAVTEEEASEYKKRFGNSKRFFLVTNAVHMPRALIIFRKLGLNPIPAPTNNYIKTDLQETNLKWLKPSYGKIEMMDKAMHEYFGMGYFFLKHLLI